MPVKVKRKELEKIGIKLLSKKWLTTYYISMLLLSDDIEVTEVRPFGRTTSERYIQTFKKNDAFYNELKELYLSKL